MKSCKKNFIYKFLKWFLALILSIFCFWKLFFRCKKVQKKAKEIKKKTKVEIDHRKEEFKKINIKFFKIIKKFLKDYLLPHEGNGHRPKALRPKALSIYVGVIIALKVIVTGVLFFIYPNQAILTSKIVDNLYRLTNETRAENGLPPLEINSELALAAQRKVDDMVSKDYFAHISPDNKYPWQFIDSSKYKFSFMGENLAMDFSSAEVVHSAFINSPSHRTNILNPKYKDIGIALKVGQIDGKETIVLAQFFGTQKVSAGLAAATTDSSNGTGVSSKEPQEDLGQKNEVATVENDAPLQTDNSSGQNYQEAVNPEITKQDINEEESPSAQEIKVHEENSELTLSNKKTDEDNNDFAFNGIPLTSNPAVQENNPDYLEKDEFKEISESESASETSLNKIADLDAVPGAQLVVVEQPNLKPGLVDLLVSWSRNFMTLMLVVLSSLLLVNILIKTRVQHAHVIMHCLIAIFIIAAMLLVRFHTIEKFIF